ncbi:hypothetical protein [Leptospira levettii]|uniref:Uncharacterized protein n=1 Tax=Leptospira levettii TaxID=2023178 RepID=A0AAW5VCS8_9LEPT|nr:hypothetical protein [Leptospira levettii]MCW7467286.1 hypothetical protein [Leptospira levettii]MCW7513008.1 hypothetical protein [Leptospira levettii]MCW7516858.1 hypothetical protein [Leptospira levettii]
MKSIFSVHQPEEKWNHRYSELLKICDEFKTSPRFASKVSIDYDKFSKAVMQVYPQELTEVKTKLQLRVLDRHKVAALTSIVVYRSSCVTVSPNSGANAFCQVSSELFGIHIGLSNLGKPSILLRNKDEILASIITQLRHNEASVTSLSCIYFMLEEEFNDKAIQSAIKV